MLKYEQILRFLVVVVGGGGRVFFVFFFLFKTKSNEIKQKIHTIRRKIKQQNRFGIEKYTNSTEMSHRRHFFFILP